MRAPTFGLIVQEYPGGPAPPVVEVSGELVAVSIETQVPGGFATGSVGWELDARGRPVALLPTPIAVPRHAYMGILANGAIIWEGRALQRRRPGGHVRAVQGIGYYLHAMADDWYRGGIGTTSAGNLVREVVRRNAPMFRVATGPDFVDSQLLVDRAEMYGRTPLQIISQLSAAGGGGDPAVPWMPLVYEDLVLRWKPQVVEGTPTYTIPIDDTVMIEEDDDDLWGQASLLAKLSAEERRLLTATAAGGNARHALLSASVSGTTSGMQYLRTWLAQRQTTRYSVSISRDYDRGLERTDGGEDAPWEVRSGSSIQVGDLPAALITRTRFEGRPSGRLDIRVGPPPTRTLARLLEELAEFKGLVRSGSSPLTIAREV